MDLAERRANSKRHPWELARSDHFRHAIHDATVGRRVESLLDMRAGGSLPGLSYWAVFFKQ